MVFFVGVSIHHKGSLNQCFWFQIKIYHGKHLTLLFEMTKNIVMTGVDWNVF